jgi:bacteriorhodopsin
MCSKRPKAWKEFIAGLGRYAGMETQHTLITFHDAFLVLYTVLLWLRYPILDLLGVPEGFALYNVCSITTVWSPTPVYQRLTVLELMSIVIQPNKIDDQFTQ